MCAVIGVHRKRYKSHQSSLGPSKYKIGDSTSTPTNRKKQKYNDKNTPTEGTTIYYIFYFVLYTSLKYGKYVLCNI
jgi:hypothetical protein